MLKISYSRRRFPPSVIQHAVWLYLRFSLSYRDVEDLLSERGLDLSYETVRQWVSKLGLIYTRTLRRRRPRPGGRWHLDEMFVSIGGRRMYLWRAVDSEGELLDILVQPRRDKRAALKLMRKLLKKHEFTPSAVVTDRLRSYSSALRDLGLSDRQETGGRKNNRAENAHQPVRRRERPGIGFKSPGTTQRFPAIHAAVYNHFNSQRHLISGRMRRQFRRAAMDEWRAVVAA